MGTQQQSDRVNRAIVGGMARIGYKAMRAGLLALIKSIGPVVIFYIGFILLVFFLIGIAYTAVFIMPQHIAHESIESGKGRIISFFNFGDKNITKWTEEDDKNLQERYIKVSNSWREGLTEYQQEQTEMYGLSWAVLAAVDRVIGDPTVNPEIKDGKEFEPNPEEHYKILKPDFKWRDSTIKRIVRWRDKETGKMKERETIEEVKILTFAETFEANYTFEYETRTETRVEGDRTIIETKEFVTNVEETGPYFKKLKSLLNNYGLGKKEELNLEFVLELATVYDEDYKYSLEERWLLDGEKLDGDIPQYDDEPIISPGSGRFICPLPAKSYRISSNFGWRTHPISKKRSFHHGVDMAAPAGTPIYASRDGQVSYAGWRGAYGNTVMINHGGYTTLYGHMSKILTTKGKRVKAGDLIGRVGTTGNSTGNHLHFEIRDTSSGKTKYLNPLNYINR